MLRAILAGLALFALTAAADARPKHSPAVAAECGVSMPCAGVTTSKAPVRRSAASARPAWSEFGSLSARARQHVGASAAQLGLRRNLWCAAFINMITNGGTGSEMAKSFAHFGSPASYGCTDCIAVLTRRGGGHVGIVTGYDNRGNPNIISGNHNGRVGESVYPRSRVIAWRHA